MAKPPAAKSKKPIRVHRVRKVLHVGIDLADAPWVSTLVRAMPANVENHGPHADDATASLLQLHRPEFPLLKPSAGPGPMNRMARVMRGYELVLSHGERAFPATMGHTLFGQALKLPPLIHLYDGVGEVPRGWWSRFRHRLGLARTPLVIVPTQAAAEAVSRDWQVPAKNVKVLPPLCPPKSKVPGPDAIPRLMKRKGEKWIAMRAADALALAETVLPALARIDDGWHLVVFGPEAACTSLRKLADGQGLTDRIHTTARLHGPATVAGLFDMAVIDGRDGLVPPDLPALMAAGVPIVAAGPEGLGELLPAASADLRIGPDQPDDIGRAIERIAGDGDEREGAGKANAELAAQWQDAAPYLDAFAAVMGLASLSDR